MFDHSVIHSFFGSKQLREKFDYDGNGNIIYHGVAIRGTATSATGWLIRKYTVNASNQPTDGDEATVFGTAWDNRTTGSYS